MRLQPQELRQSYINTEAVAIWNLPRLTFLSPERPCFLTKISGTLLEHYVTRTGSQLVPFPPSCNPFVRLLLHTAISDDLIMHSLLALSGVHYSGYDNIEEGLVSRATWSHYAAVVRSLRTELASFGAGPEDSIKTLRLLVVLIILFHYEVCA
jgi:hypothetical protein